MSMAEIRSLTFPNFPHLTIHGWGKCNRIVATILAMWVGGKVLPSFPALPTSDLHGWRKCNRIVGTILAMWVGWTGSYCRGTAFTNGYFPINAT